MSTVIKLLLYIPHLIRAVWCVIRYLWSTFVLQVPCSYPGDPLKRQLSRCGKWSNRKGLAVSSGWKFASDKESHLISEKRSGKELR